MTSRVVVIVEVGASPPTMPVLLPTGAMAQPIRATWFCMHDIVSAKLETSVTNEPWPTKG